MPAKITPEHIATNGYHQSSKKNESNGVDTSNTAQNQLKSPIKYTGLLDTYTYHDLTPVIGREYVDLQISAILASSNRDALVRDLSATISQRGVVFLRAQQVSPEQMQALTELISSLAGSPASSGLHTHPLNKDAPELATQYRIGTISSEAQKQGGGITHQQDDYSRYASVGWHSDITFEQVPSDYAMLKIHTLPPTGGDTLWASGYELYDRLSPPMQRLLEGLTATHDANFFHDDAKRMGHTIQSRVRGSPLNISTDLRAHHPIIRTNPVTGWKALFVNRGFTTRIDGVTKDESDLLLQYLFNLLTQNHDAQVRFKWGKDDVAIWDNRCTMHCATYDYGELRVGDRACSLGETPFLDVLGSRGRREALREVGPE